jgi:hypothetical protein
MSHISEDQLVLHYYAEADDEASIASHLAACDACRSVFQELQQTLAIVSSTPAPDRPQDYGRLVWKSIKPHLGVRPRAGWMNFRHLPQWAFASGMAALLVAAFLVGRYWPHPQEIVPPQAVSADIGARILLASAADHLERSQNVLLDLAHAGGQGEIDISGEQALARELLESNRLYRQTAVRNGEMGLATVLDDLERTLLEIVHRSPSIASSDLDDVRRQIESEGILFKLRVTAARMRERQNAAARELGRRST